MPLGAGICPAGLAAAGYGVPDTASVPLNAVLPDPTTGLSQTGRYINPKTKDYVFTADGRVQGMPTAQQLVYLAMQTVLGSSALPTLGFDTSGITEKSGDYVRRVASAVSKAFAPIVRQGLVTMNGVDVQDGASVGVPDAAALVATWTDNSSGKQFQYVIGS